MTSRDWEVVAVAVAISAVAGIILGVWIHHRIKLSVTAIAVIAVLFFSTLEWRFGGPETWPWQDTAAQDLFIFGHCLL